MNPDPQDLSQIRHVQVADPVSAEVTSQPTRAIELRLKALENALFNNATKSGALIIPNVNVQTSGAGAVSLYSAVFYNPATELYELALADVSLISGTFKSNPTALTVGIVIALNGTKADVMIGGFQYWGSEMINMQNALLVEQASGFIPGSVYYLSDIFPGKVTIYPPSLRIQVLLTSDSTYIVAPAYSTPEAIQNIYTDPVGMRPVGSLRQIAPDFKQSIIVGFDALECYDEVNNQWRQTTEGAIPNHVGFGYIVADATVAFQSTTPLYVGFEIAKTSDGGVITAYTSVTLAGLFSSGSTAGLAALSSNASAVRTFNIPGTSSPGSIKFFFTDPDTTYRRRVVFKFPDHFQGWKSTNASIPPTATATVNTITGHVTGIQVGEGSVGYVLPPTVIMTGGGAGAAATASINDFGTITGITVTNAGSGYTSAPAVSFDTTVSSVQVLNGGGGAVLTPVIAGGQLTGVTITNGGTGYYLDPAVSIIDPLGAGSGAEVTVSCLNGIITTATVTKPGSGYSGSTLPALLVKPKFNGGYVVGGSTPPIAALTTASGTPPTFSPVYRPQGITVVDVVSGGCSYSSGATAVASGGSGSGAVLTPIRDASGHITSILISNPGTGYTSVPTITISDSGNGNGAIAIARIGCSLNTMGVSDGGSGVAYPANIALGVPISNIEVDLSGQGYTAAPGVTISAPDLTGGTQATATTVIGGAISEVTLLTNPAIYSPSAPPTITVSAPAAGGVQAVLALGINGSTGAIDNIEIVNPGAGYLMKPTITISAVGGNRATAACIIQGQGVGAIIGSAITGTAPSGYSTPPTATIVDSSGAGAALQAMIGADGTLEAVTILTPGFGYASPALYLNGVDVSANVALYLDNLSVTAINLTNAGNGYTKPPTVTVAPPTFGDSAVATAKTLGGTAQMQVAVNGGGGSRFNGALQIRNYETDCPGVTRPSNAPFYYNMPADPSLAGDYPAVPIDKFMFMLNGVELRPSVLNESQRLVADSYADIAASRKTLLWTTMDTEGCPWDASYQQYVNDTNAAGDDCIIPTTGPAGFITVFWKLWDQVYGYELQRNKGWIHLNKASRFFQSGQLRSLSVLAPLVAFDAVTGVQARNDGTPMTGQVILGVEGAVVSAGNTANQINLTNPGELVIIYQNSLSRPLAITSILLQTIFQTSAAGSVPDATMAATITIGTTDGSYRNVIGNNDADIASACLFALNQSKVLFPDADSPTPVLQPNQALYINVVQPAGSAITTQIAKAQVQGLLL